MEVAVGEAQGVDLRLAFDCRLKLEFHGTKVTSDGGLLAYRELDDTLGLSESAGEVLTDTRTGANGRHTLVGQFRQSVFGRLAGYEDVNDADRLAHDPALRWVVGGQAVTGQAASTSQMGRFETEVLTQEANLSALTDLSGRWIDRCSRPPPREGDRAGHGLQRQPDLRGSGGQRLQRPLWLHLLSSAVRVQPVRRPGAVCASSRQRSLR